jgi:hypothetical protein
MRLLYAGSVPFLAGLQPQAFSLFRQPPASSLDPYLISAISIRRNSMSLSRYWGVP